MGEPGKPEDPLLGESAIGGDEVHSAVEDITHPEYDFSTVAAIGLIKENTGLFGRIPHLARSQLLASFTTFFDQEQKPKTVQPGPVNLTILPSGNAPQTFKSIYGHFLHVCGYEMPTKVATTMKYIIEKTTQLMRDGLHKPVEFFRRMIQLEHSGIIKYKEYGRHSIDSTAGVHGNAIDLSNYEGSAGEFLKLGLAKGVLEILQNQANLAGVAPFAEQEVCNSRAGNRQAATDILKEIEDHGWSNLLGESSELDDTPLLRTPSTDISKFTHDITTKLGDPTLQPEVTPVAVQSTFAVRSLHGVIVNQQYDVDSPDKPNPISPPIFSKLELKEKGLAGITVRIMTKDGKYYVDTHAKRALSLSSLELEKVMSQYKDYSFLKWLPVEKMYEHTDETTWPTFVISNSDNQPNPYSSDSNIFRFRGALGRTPLHLHVSEYKRGGYSQTRKDMHFWSGHWAMNGSEQNEIVKETKKVIKSKIPKRAKIERALASEFIIYPPLPSKDFGYKEEVPSSRDMQRAEKGLAGPEPTLELTQARLESLGLTDIELRKTFSSSQVDSALKQINRYWNRPLTDALNKLMDPGAKLEDVTTSHREQALAFRASLDAKIFEKFPNIEGEELEIQRTKIRKEIRNYLTPQFNRTQLYSMIAGLDGSAGFCVITNPQKQNGLAIGLAATLGKNVTAKLNKFMQDVRPVASGSEKGIGLDQSDRDEILSSFIATALEQTFTRLGISPLAVLDDMVAEYPDVAEAIAKLVTPDLKKKTYLVTQLSELPIDKIDDPVADGDVFTSAGSARRKTTARAIGLKGNLMTWRVRIADPEFFETLSFDNLTTEINDVAKEYSEINTPEHTSTYMQDVANVESMNMALDLWNIRETPGKGQFYETFKSLFSKSQSIGAEHLSNAVKLDNFMKLVHHLPEQKIKDLFRDKQNTDIVSLRKTILEGFKMLTTASLISKMQTFNNTTNTFSTEVAKIARKNNFADAVRMSTPNAEELAKFHVRYPVTAGMDLKMIRKTFNELYDSIESQGLIDTPPRAYEGNSSLVRFLIKLVSFADSDGFVNEFMKGQVAKIIPSYDELRIDSTQELPIPTFADLEQENLEQ